MIHDRAFLAIDPKAGRRSEHTVFTHPFEIALPTRPESRSPVRAHYFYTPFGNTELQDPKAGRWSEHTVFTKPFGNSSAYKTRNEITGQKLHHVWHDIRYMIF